MPNSASASTFTRQRLSFYADASYAVTFDGDADGVAGQLGVK
jgi:hypothetical protein